MSISGQVSSLGEVLSQQAIRVFVRSALPRAVRITEVDFHIRGHREGFVFCHLQPAVPRHWEGDLIGGTKNSHIATLVERHSRFTALVKVRSKDTAAVVAAVSRQIRKLPASLRRSLTGNGAVLDFCGPFPDGDGRDCPATRECGERRMRRLDRRCPISFFFSTPRACSPVVRQIFASPLNFVHVTMLQASQHAIHFNRILNFGEGQRSK